MERLKNRFSQMDVSNRIAANYGEVNRIWQERISNIETAKASYVDIAEIELIAEAVNSSIDQIIKY